VGRAEEKEDLTYPEWVELLGLVAFTLGDTKLKGLRNDLVTSMGVEPAWDEQLLAEDGGRGGMGASVTTSVTGGAASTLRGAPGSTMPMLSKLHLLFFNMFELGARFDGKEGSKFIRAVTQAVRKEAAEARAEAAALSRAAAQGQSRRVGDVLSESVYA